MEVASLRTVATAAVREASNGPEFLARIRAMGLAVELLSGEQEAAMAGYGVLAAFPGAEGIVGDLGGGSLELVRVGGGEVHERVSFPLGVLRIAKIRAEGPRALDRVVANAIAAAGWEGHGAGCRSISSADRGARSRGSTCICRMRRCRSSITTAWQRTARPIWCACWRRSTGSGCARCPASSGSRIATLGDAAALLSVLSRRLGSSELIVSGYGLREGLLHQSLPAAVRAQDPLICATRDEGVRQGRFAEHGDLLYRWISPLFASEIAGDARLRHAACLLADVGWPAHPEFRAERGLETALHGNWVGVDPRGRGHDGARALYELRRQRRGAGRSIGCAPRPNACWPIAGGWRCGSASG